MQAGPLNRVSSSMAPTDDSHSHAAAPGAVARHVPWLAVTWASVADCVSPLSSGACRGMLVATSSRGPSGNDRAHGRGVRGYASRRSGRRRDEMTSTASPPTSQVSRSVRAGMPAHMVATRSSFARVNEPRTQNAVIRVSPERILVSYAVSVATTRTTVATRRTTVGPVSQERRTTCSS
jgi:hypothetical protein